MYPLRVTISKNNIPYHYANKGSGFRRISKIEYNKLNDTKSNKTPAKKVPQIDEQKYIKLERDRHTNEFPVNSSAEVITLLKTNKNLDLKSFCGKHRGICRLDVEVWDHNITVDFDSIFSIWIGFYHFNNKEWKQILNEFKKIASKIDPKYRLVDSTKRKKQ